MINFFFKKHQLFKILKKSNVNLWGSSTTYFCTKHGEVTQTISYVSGNKRKTYCTECIFDRLSQLGIGVLDE